MLARRGWTLEEAPDGSLTAVLDDLRASVAWALDQCRKLSRREKSSRYRRGHLQQAAAYHRAYMSKRRQSP
ncbi:MAG TPA: hypothetical protein VHY22_05455 [Chthoniobacteraceae bacterium]|nr:hypothetical protein [Chthoniobacteraceae bacterium]